MQIRVGELRELLQESVQKSVRYFGYFEYAAITHRNRLTSLNIQNAIRNVIRNTIQNACYFWELILVLNFDLSIRSVI